MESNMFTDDLIRKELDRYVLAELYTDRETPEDVRNGEMQENRFKTVALPLYVILDPRGTRLRSSRSHLATSRSSSVSFKRGVSRVPQVAHVRARTRVWCPWNVMTRTQQLGAG
jgi:hypothetical protein